MLLRLLYLLTLVNNDTFGVGEFFFHFMFLSLPDPSQLSISVSTSPIVSPVISVTTKTVSSAKKYVFTNSLGLNKIMY